MKSDSKEKAVWDLYDQYADAIFRFCFLRLYDRGEARDVTQEVFFRAWRYSSRGGVIENPRPFLYKTAVHLIITANQKRRPISLDALREEGFDPGFDDRDRRTDILDGLRALEEVNQLDGRSAEAVVLRYVEDLSPKEIAIITGESENVISVRLHRALKKLKERMIA